MTRKHGVSPIVDVTLEPTTNDHGILEVALVPSADASGPVVDVQLVATRTRVEQLLTLTALQAVRRATPKPSTKLDRAIASKAARLEDKRKLEVWAKAVKDRDEWKDRKTGQIVRSTRQLDPLRAEAHHIEPKENRATRYDVRNGVCLSFESHFLVTTHRYRIAGTKFFRLDGQIYIDGSAPIYFVRV
jgi:hypothetical protein